MKNIFKFIVLKPKLVLFFSIIAVLILAFFSTKIEIDASTQTLLLENDKELKIWRDIAKRYESKNFLVVAYTPNDDLLSQKTLEKIDNLSKDLERLEFVESVFSVLDAPLLQNKNIPLSELIKDIPNLRKPNTDKIAAKREFLSSEIYKNNLVSGDFKTTAILVNLKNDAKYAEFIAEISHLNELEQNSTLSPNDTQKLKILNENFKIYRDQIRQGEHENIVKIREILERHKGDERLFLGGINMIADDMVSFVKNDLLVYGVSVTALLSFCLWLFFRQIRFVVLPIAICLASLIAASGFFGILGYEITVISSNYVALQLIITISVIIHLIVAYREFYFTHPNFNQRQLVFLTLISRANPCFFAIFTTVIGFISLCLSDIKPIIMLGIMMSVGISISLIVAFLMFGAGMVFLSKIPPKRNFEDSFHFTQWCAKIAINHRKIVYSLSLVAVLFGIIGILMLKVENSFIKYFKQNTEIYKGMEVIDKNLGGTIPLDIIVKFPEVKSENSQPSDEFLAEFESEFMEKETDAQYWFADDKMQIIRKIHKFLQNREFIGNVSSLGTLLSVGKNLNNGNELDSLGLAILYNGLPQQYKSMLLSPFVSIENNEAHFVIRTIDSDDNLRRDHFIKSLQNDLNELVKNDGVKVGVHGTMVLYNNMLQSLLSSQVDTFGFVVLALFVVFIFIFKSLTLSFIAIVSNLVPLCVVFGVMGVVGIPLDIMSITIAAISLGIGVDDVIHYIHRYKQEIRTKSKLNAIVASHASIGYAMYYTSFAVFLGFSVMTSSNFLPTIYFGLLIDLVMFMMLISALILMPAMIISFYGIKFSTFSPQNQG